MKKLFILILLYSSALSIVGYEATAQNGVNIHIGADGINVRPDEFVNYYQAPPDRLSWLQQNNIPETQWPLLFELARAGKTTTDRVWELRQQNSSWNDVLVALGVAPSYFYYDNPPSQQLAAPYGRAYGYYRNNPTEAARWSDQDLYNLASVRYIVENTRRPVDEVVRLYQKQPRFINSSGRVVNVPNTVKIDPIRIIKDSINSNIRINQREIDRNIQGSKQLKKHNKNNYRSRGNDTRNGNKHGHRGKNKKH